jgi:hypothetical protein
MCLVVEGGGAQMMFSPYRSECSTVIYSQMQCCMVVWQMVINIFEELAASIFMVEVCTLNMKIVGFSEMLLTIHQAP